MGFVSEFKFQLKELSKSFLQFFDYSAEKILNAIPEKKRKPALIWAGTTVFALLMVLFVSAFTKKPLAEEGESYRIYNVNADDLFFPPEPDFLPDYILEREPNPQWGIEEVRLWWKDPLQGNRIVWQEEMISLIDDLLESVP